MILPFAAIPCFKTFIHTYTCNPELLEDARSSGTIEVDVMLHCTEGETGISVVCEFAYVEALFHPIVHVWHQTHIDIYATQTDFLCTHIAAHGYINSVLASLH